MPGPKYECMHCGEFFWAADSVAKGTPELMKRLYCSLECHDKDSEHIDEQIQLAKETDALENAFKDEEFQTIEAGGFKLKVPIKKEN